MDPELRNLMRDVATLAEPGGDYTHITVHGTRQRWHVRHENLMAFWTQYCDLVDLKINGRNDSKPDPLAALYLAEKPQNIMPVIAKFILKFNNDSNDNNWEPYDDTFLAWLCFTYQSILMEYFQITPSTHVELLGIILESNNHWFEESSDGNQKFICWEVCIHFPYATVDVGVQNRIIRDKVISALRENMVLAKMNRQPIGDWEQIIPSNTIDSPVIMYGSSENAQRPKLEIKHIWHNIAEDILNNHTLPDELELDTVFFPNNHNHVQHGGVSPTIFGDKPLKHWLPMFLSLDYWPKVLLLKDGIIDTMRSRPSNHNIQNDTASSFATFGTNTRTNTTDDTDLDLAERLIPMLKPKRFLIENYWIDIGRALYMADDGGENGLLSWIRHTEKSLVNVSDIPNHLKHTDGLTETCRQLYYTFSSSTITIKTLAWYAKEDSAKTYGEWHREWCMASMENALSLQDTDVAISLHRVYWLDFVYCSVGRGKWFQFRNHRWIECNQGIALRKIISNDFMKRFEAVKVILARQVYESNDENFKSRGETTEKRLIAMIGKLKTGAFKNRLMTEATEHFNHDKFMGVLDTNPMVTGVTNGALEVIGNRVDFRAAKPEDFISMCTNIPFHNMYTWSHPLILETMKWLGQVFADKSLLHHFLKFAASCLIGRNLDKIFPVWTGEGDNSKSMFVKLFEATLGSYCIKFPVSMLSEKMMNSSGPTPQLARAKSTRIAFLDEPDDDIPMQKGTIKRYTGGDSFFARLLQENGGDIQATFKMILMCNKVPIIPNADKAIKNRLRIFPFLSKWIDNAPENEEEQMRARRFKKNPIFERKIPFLAPAFLWIMTQYYPYYASEGLVDPQIITDYTGAYWRDNDLYAQFSADLIQEVYGENGERDAGARITLSEIYQEFKIWFRDSCPGIKVPDRQAVRSELSARWGHMHGNAWHGIRIVNAQSTTDMTANLGGRKPTIIAETVKNVHNFELNKITSNDNHVVLAGPVNVNSSRVTAKLQLIPY